MFSYISFGLLIAYAIYISIVDMKKHQLEYWQSGVTYIFALLYSIFNINLINATTFKAILIKFLGFLVLFVLFLILATIKIKGKAMAFGGADIWVAGAFGLAIGLYDISYFLLVVCTSFLLFILALKIIRKKRPEKIAFVPFLSIGLLTITSLYIIF